LARAYRDTPELLGALRLDKKPLSFMEIGSQLLEAAKAALLPRLPVENRWRLVLLSGSIASGFICGVSICGGRIKP
jgi:hypothetical protein